MCFGDLCYPPINIDQEKAALIEKQHLAMVALKDQEQQQKTANRLNRPDKATARYNRRQGIKMQDDENRAARNMANDIKAKHLKEATEMNKQLLLTQINSKINKDA
jgi:hypothetical protein